MSGDLSLIDIVTMTVMLIATTRGIWIGLIREGLSLAAIGLCTIVTRLLIEPVSVQLTDLTGGEITGKTAVWIAGVVLVMATVLVCGIIARLVKRGAEAAGLGWADRLGGGALGLAEGSVVAAVIVLISLWLVGPDHEAMKGARAVEIVEQLQSARDNGELPSVTSPGKWF